MEIRFPQIIFKRFCIFGKLDLHKDNLPLMRCKNVWMMMMIMMMVIIMKLRKVIDLFSVMRIGSILNSKCANSLFILCIIL